MYQTGTRYVCLNADPSDDVSITPPRLKQRRPALGGGGEGGEGSTWEVDGIVLATWHDTAARFQRDRFFTGLANNKRSWATITKAVHAEGKGIPCQFFIG